MELRCKCAAVRCKARNAFVKVHILPNDDPIVFAVCRGWTIRNILQQKCLKKWIGSTLLGTRWNFQHLAPQYTSSQTDDSIIPMALRAAARSAQNVETYPERLSSTQPANAHKSPYSSDIYVNFAESFPSILWFVDDLPGCCLVDITYRVNALNWLVLISFPLTSVSPHFLHASDIDWKCNIYSFLYFASWAAMWKEMGIEKRYNMV